MREVRLETLLGADVRGLAGELLGRVRDVSAERSERVWVVRGLLLEPVAMLRRRLFEGTRRHLLVPWNVLDWTNPRELRLRIGLEHLDRRLFR